MSLQAYQLDDVFTAGGIPTHTYVERDHGALKADFEAALRSKTRMLTLYGPTKSGKTVLVVRVLDGDAVVVDGGSVTEEDDLWSEIVDRLGGWTSRIDTESFGEETTASGEGGLSGGVPGIVQAKSRFGLRHKHKESVAEALGVEVPAKRAALRELEDAGVPLVIDDFHYLPAEVRTKAVRALKGPVSRGLPVVLITVSHRVLDAVKSETDVRGRVHPLEIPAWTDDELRSIALTGFGALNISCERKLLDDLVLNAFGSPHLMQAVCHELCLENKVTCTQPERLALSQYRDPQAFFRHALGDGGSVAFDRLCLGPHSGRKLRKQRRRRFGGTADVYEATLEAIRLSGPKTRLAYSDIRSLLDSVLDPDDMPRKNEITAALRSLADIAREQIDGEPVLDWNPELELLHIADPFFAYHLKWHADFKQRCGGRRVPFISRRSAR